MAITREQEKLLNDALTAAFNYGSLRRMVKLELGEDLDGLVERGAFKQQVFELIEWAGRTDRVEELIKAARAANPNNKKIEDVEVAILGSSKPHEDTTVDTYTDEKTGLEMIRIPAGEFIYGEEDRLEYLPEYWISKTPSTNVQYLRFVRETDHSPPYHWKEKSPKAEIADHPVVWVSLYDAKDYADWAGMDLPTEKEWEKAARGTDGRIYPWGNEWRDGYCNTDKARISTTTPVGRYSPPGDSPYGCVDMVGNVWEWTVSRYDLEEDERVLRGGSWNDYLNFARAAYRGLNLPLNRSNFNIGFRVVLRRPPSK